MHIKRWFSAAAVAAVCLAGASTVRAGSCIISGDTNSVPASVSIQREPVSLVTGEVGEPSVPEAVESRIFDWDISSAVQILTDKLGFLLFLR